MDQIRTCLVRVTGSKAIFGVFPAITLNDLRRDILPYIGRPTHRLEWRFVGSGALVWADGWGDAVSTGIEVMPSMDFGGGVYLPDEWQAALGSDDGWTPLWPGWVDAEPAKDLAIA